jgi:hypothetical protein
MRDHLNAFKNISGFKTTFLNLSFFRSAKVIDFIKPTLMVFHNSALGRTSREGFSRRIRPWIKKAKFDCPVYAFPQDEFWNTDLLDAAMVELGVSRIFSVAPNSVWQDIYPQSLEKKIIIQQVLTGYIKENACKEKIQYSKWCSREFDMVYRAFDGVPWLGRHGKIKQDIASKFINFCEQHKLKADISVRSEDTILGNDWMHFLKSSKFTIGVEGGSSIHDRDGSIQNKVLNKPNWKGMSFEELEKECFPNRDGEFNLKALSPRHLEACVTGTIQILVEGAYNDVLVPDIHYIPLKADFSNTEEIYDKMNNEHYLRKMHNAIDHDIIQNREYGYSKISKLIELADSEDHINESKSFFLMSYVMSFLIEKSAALLMVLVSRLGIR